MIARPTYDDANLILRLYEMRRDDRMREARQWYTASFRPKKWEDLATLVPGGSAENASYRMVISYWDMVASFIVTGVLNKELFFQSGRELLVVFERLQAGAARDSRGLQGPAVHGQSRARRSRLRGLLAGAEPRRLRGLREAHRVTRLVALDVDGTLLDGRGQIPAANLEALHAAAARGIHLVVVTGRSYPFVLPAVAALPDPLTLVVYNGAVARARGGDTIVRRTLDPAVARRVLSHTRDWRASTTVQFDRADAGQTLFDQLSWDHPNRRGYYDKVRHHVSQVDDLEAADAERRPGAGGLQRPDRRHAAGCRQS